MKATELPSFQNVSIEYVLPSAFDRCLAWFVDIFLLGTFSGISALIGSLVFGSDKGWILYFVILPVFFFYSLLFEIFNQGQTPGKKLMNLRVIRADGAIPQLNNFFIRWAFRMLDIYLTLGGAAILSIAASSRNQRIGDFMANTMVVKKTNSRVSLKTMGSLSKISKDSVKYPGVVSLSENDMLLVKETVIRYKKYKNDAHNKAINLLVSKIENELDIKCDKSKVEFLETLIHDYVILTR